MVDSTIRGQLCQLFVFVLISSVCINFNTTFASDGAPKSCNATSEATLDGVKIEIFAFTAKITINLTDTTFLANASLSLKTDFSNSSDPTSTEEFPDDLIVIVFDDLALGSYYLKVEGFSNDTEQFFTCALDAIKTENATCSDETLSEFSVSWNESSLFRPWNIESTDPQINSTSNQSNSFTFSGLDAGQEYNVHFVRSSTTDGIETLIYEELTCVTLTACDFTNNSYIEQVTFLNSDGNQVEVNVQLTQNCSACKIKLVSLNGSSSEGEGQVRNVFKEEGFHISIVNMEASKDLFQCSVTTEMLTWIAKASCLNETETTFVTEINFNQSSFEIISINSESPEKKGILLDGTDNKASAKFSDLIPKTTYNLLFTHEQASNGILYMDKYFCNTTNVVNTENFTEADVGTDYVTVSWNYPAIGEAEFFKLLWNCKAPSNCSSIQERSLDVAKNGLETIIYNITELEPATTYELNLTAEVPEVKDLSSVVQTLTINTKPTKIKINATTNCRISPTTITMTWTHSENGYDGLHYRIISNATSNIIQTNTSHLFDELDPDTKYSFSISAHRESVDGEATSFVCSSSAVPEIGNLVIADKNQTMIKLTWNYVADLPETVKFEVFCQGSKNCSERQLVQNSSDKEVQIDDLLPGEEFTFVVRALVNQHPSSNATLTARTELNTPDLSNMKAKSPDNQIQLPVFNCSQEQKVLNVSVFWTNQNGADNCEDVPDFELNRNFTVPDKSFDKNCDNSYFQLKPLNSDKNVSYGDVICLKLILQSGEETAEAVKEVPLYPDSVSNLTCPREDITTSSIQVSWDKGRGSFLNYVVISSKSNLSSQLHGSFIATSFNFTDIPHGTLLDFFVKTIAANGLESQEKSVECRTKVEVPEFSAIEVNKTRVKIDSKVDFNEAITTFSLAVYNRSTENHCSGQLGSVVFDQTFTDNITNFILPEQREILPGGVYCIEITTTAFGSLSESNSDVQKVALYPEVPEIQTDITNSTHAIIRITNYQDVIFGRIEYALSELVWDSTNSNWISREFKTAQKFETTEIDFNNLPKGTVLTVTVTAFSNANLSATNETRFQTKPDTPTITYIATTSTSCTFTVSASKIVTAFQGKLNESSGNITTILKNDSTKERVSADFNFSGLESHTVYWYEFHAISVYEGFESASDNLTVS